MTEWTLLKRLLDAVHHHSTMIGRLWLTVMVIFRLLIVAVATEDVYTDEQEMFVCNTLQPGCSTICYDAFAPISQPRFWVFHIISVSTPSLCFIIYTWHNLSKQNGQLQKLNTNNDVQAIAVGVLSKCYIFHVILRAILEVGFVLAQWKLFGFSVPVHFLCTSEPCSQPVDCYVSRPTEKTVFLLFMFCVGIFCILLNLLELNHLGWKKIRQIVKLREEASWTAYSGLRKGYENLPADSPSPTSSLGLRDATSTTSLPTLNLVVSHQPTWTCAANCGKAKEAPSSKGKREGRPSKQRSAEVWI
uniref:Gap junction protein n=1 Tax=Neogobius melanostomus TaxID=47308 RepID=A0A8C6WET6_9GOBI